MAAAHNLCDALIHVVGDNALVDCDDADRMDQLSLKLEQAVIGGDARAAATLAFELGALAAELRQRVHRRRGGALSAGRRRAAAAIKAAAWQRMAEDVWRRHPTWSTLSVAHQVVEEIARLPRIDAGRFAADVGTIRRAIRRPER